MDMKKATTRESGMYTVESGTFSYTTRTLESAMFHCKRIGLARCEEAFVIAPSGAIVYSY